MGDAGGGAAAAGLVLRPMKLAHAILPRPIELSLPSLRRLCSSLILRDPKFGYAICHCNSVAGTPATQPQRCARRAIWALRNTIVQHEVAELKRGSARVRSEARLRMRQRAHVSTPSAELLLSCMQWKVACERRPRSSLLPRSRLSRSYASRARDSARRGERIRQHSPETAWR
jgi:hypothetical protein